MKKEFKDAIVHETLDRLRDNANLEVASDWKKKRTSYSISIYKDVNIPFYAYLGIRFIPNRDYIIPYLRISSKDIGFADECENNANLAFDDYVNYITSGGGDLTLYKNDFDDYTNTSLEVINPTNDLINLLLLNEDSFNHENAKKYGITTQSFSSEMIRTWDLFEEFFFISSIEHNEIKTIIKPVLNDIDRVVFEYYAPFLEKLKL